MNNNCAVCVEHLKKDYKLSKKQKRLENTSDSLKHAVNDVSFKTTTGEIYGLLGSNGAGKTTTLRMLSTLIQPTSGTAYISGHSIINESEQVRRCLGFLTSDLKLEDMFTPDYLFDFFATLHGLDKKTYTKRKADLFGRFGIDKFAQTKVANLSTGMKQKTSLAITLAHDPHVIIFDEPTNGLDVLTARVVTDLLLDLKAEGKSILISTHIFSLVEKICDHVGIIVDGQLVANGSLAAIQQGQSLEDAFFDLYKSLKGDIT